MNGSVRFERDVADNGASVEEVVGWVRRRSLPLLAGGLVGGIVAATLAVTSAPRFTSTASFVSQGRRSTTGAASVVAQFGVDLSSFGASGAEAPQFYVELLKSRLILAHLADAQFTVEGDRIRRTDVLPILLDAGGNTPALRREDAIKRLERMMSASVAPKSGIVWLKVTSRAPELSQQLAMRALQALDAYNLSTRQSQARAERQFAASRLEQARRDLAGAEDRMFEFRMRNKLTVAPALALAEERLRREVRTQEQLVLTLQQAYERARLDEVRDTPVLTVVQAPERPVMRDARRVALKSLVGFLVGIVLALSILLVQSTGVGIAILRKDK